MMVKTFYKNELGWFIDIPWWPFSKGHLAMIAGADVFLDKLAAGKETVKIEIATKNTPKHFDGFLLRRMKLGMFLGAIYQPLGKTKLEEYEIADGVFNRLFLCAVTLVVFGRYPRRIYYKVL